MEILQANWWLPLASLVTSIITAVSGAGGGVLLLGLMAMGLPPGAVIPVHGAVQATQNAWRLKMLWEEVDWSFVGWAAFGSVLGALIAGPVAVNLPPRIMLVVLGVGLLYLVWAPKMKFSFEFKGKTVVMAMVISIVTMVIGAAGVLFNAIRRRGGRAKEGVLADQSAIMLLQHALKVLVFGLYGFVFAPYVPLMVTMMVTAVCGTWVGVHLMKRMENQWFDWTFKTVVTVLAGKMLVDGVMLWWA